ncbi:MAG: ATP-binding cassette domain-containing protein [Candidatus Eremiobacteraeota bacterium]|nr:ATP-binding cassette domain-containing protein [Candidatus Eremiobacteraeota bacterium]
MISLRDVVVHYPGMRRPALDGFSLDVAAGETVALVGPSGSGKTTLLRAVNGLVPLTSGTVVVDGLSVERLRGRELRQLRSRIAMIAQHHDVVDRLAVHQNVMAGALGRWSTARALRYLCFPLHAELTEARAALARVSIPEKLWTRTGLLSGGERQRVAIARALVQQPEAILADEPIASLDPALASQILELLCGLARESGIALLCSLHQPLLAELYFDRVVFLRRGQIQEPAPGMSEPQKA